jgi:hypothetical protein
MRTGSGRALLCAVMFEGALMGSGRLAMIGPLTLKMWLFLLMLLYTAWALLSFEKLLPSTLLLTTSFAVLLFVAGTNGAAHAANLEFLGADMSPLLSFLVLPFFELTMRTRNDISLVIRVVLVAARVMACCYVVIVASLWLSLWLGITSLGTLYGWLAESGANDFGVSGDGTGEIGRFAYSGAIFIGIAIIFVLFKKGRSAKVGAFFLFLTLCLVASRGLFLTLALTAVCYVVIAPVPAMKKFGLGCMVVLLGVVCLPILFSLAGNRSASNSARLDTISQVYERIDPASAILGHGFGIGVPEKPQHMEIVYLEVFHKQGVLGLLWWVVLIGILAARFRKAIAVENRSLVYPLFLVAVFILLESATNPYINNPIGMYPFLISFVGLGLLAQPDTARSIANPALQASLP